MVCPIKTETQYSYNAENGDCYYSSNSSPRSNSTFRVNFQKRGTPFFPGIVTVYVTNYRYYSPEMGRWLSRDPMGEVGWNLYGMCLNRVVNCIDICGLSFTGELIGTVVTGVGIVIVLAATAPAMVTVGAVVAVAGGVIYVVSVVSDDPAEDIANKVGDAATNSANRYMLDSKDTTETDALEKTECEKKTPTAGGGRYK